MSRFHSHASAIRREKRAYCLVHNFSHSIDEIETAKKHRYPDINQPEQRIRDLFASRNKCVSMIVEKTPTLLFGHFFVLLNPHKVSTVNINGTLLVFDVDVESTFPPTGILDNENTEYSVIGRPISSPQKVAQLRINEAKQNPITQYLNKFVGHDESIVQFDKNAVFAIGMICKSAQGRIIKNEAWQQNLDALQRSKDIYKQVYGDNLPIVYYSTNEGIFFDERGIKIPLGSIKEKNHERAASTIVTYTPNATRQIMCKL